MVASRRIAVLGSGTSQRKGILECQLGQRQLTRWRRTQAVEGTMLKTRLCELLGLDVPIILAPMGTCTSAELAAAVSNEGGLGGIGSLFRPTATVKRDIDVVKTLTNRPFAINHIPQSLDAEA